MIFKIFSTITILLIGLSTIVKADSKIPFATDSSSLTIWNGTKPRRIYKKIMQLI